MKVNRRPGNRLVVSETPRKKRRVINRGMKERGAPEPAASPGPWTAPVVPQREEVGVQGPLPSALSDVSQTKEKKNKTSPLLQKTIAIFFFLL